MDFHHSQFNLSRIWLKADELRTLLFKEKIRELPSCDMETVSKWPGSDFEGCVPFYFPNGLITNFFDAMEEVQKAAILNSEKFLELDHPKRYDVLENHREIEGELMDLYYTVRHSVSLSTPHDLCESYDEYIYSFLTRRHEKLEQRVQEFEDTFLQYIENKYYLRDEVEDCWMLRRLCKRSDAYHGYIRTKE